MSTEVALTPWSLLTATAGLVAFHIGLYTLVGRERKSPYIINSVFPIFLLCLLVASVSLASALMPTLWRQTALEISGWALIAAFLFSVYRVYRITIRLVYFVDSVSPKHWPGIRQIRRWRSLRSPRPRYAHNPVPVPSELRDEIVEILRRISGGSWESRDQLELKSLAVAVEHQGQGNELLAQLAMAFLKRGFSVQYMSTSRHPIEFIGFLKDFIEKNGETWQKFTKQIVAIDAYSPHFAFIDSIYLVKTRELESIDITCVSSKMTYAGMHSASSRAFNTIKEQMGCNYRQPTLVIYEDSYALTDLESVEQYRIFVRHVLPSERMWDGMLTVFLESVQPEADWRLLQAYASMKLDLRVATSAQKNSKALPVPAPQGAER